MLQMLMKSGDTEQVLDLADTPEFVLLQFCDLIIRHQDLRNPDARYLLRETVNALKVKTDKEKPDDSASINRYALKEQLSQIDSILKNFDEEAVNQEDHSGE